jgi:glyoxylase-like metal-dependent hydrolase (beta-lactamase superfamily II)
MSSIIKSLKVIKSGFLVRTETGVILDARSTVALIQTAKNTILVDTSLRKDRDLLLDGLKNESLTPADINIIIITHCHKDHTGNCEIFPSARIYVHHLCSLKGDVIRIKEFPYFLEPNIEIIETPGHSWDSLTVLVKRDVTYAITGDAIPLKSNYENWIPPVVHVDAQRALESMKQITERADIIIPGHDEAFTLKKRDG